MGIMGYSLLWVMQELYQQPYRYHDYHDHGLSGSGLLAAATNLLRSLKPLA